MSTSLLAAYRRTGLVPRVLTAAVGIPLILGAAWSGGLWWGGLLALVAAVGASEFVRLHPEQSVAARVCTTIGALGALGAVARMPDPPAAALILLASGILAWGVGAHLAAPVTAGTVVWGRWSTALLGAIYLGLPTGVLARWREETTVAALAWLLATLWMNDIAAYFVGLAFGQHKLVPKISPGKSWEGGIAGIAGAAVTAAVGSTALGLTVGAGALFGIVASVTSQAGDLFKSTMKRRQGVKDSGTLLPGHGGILDRFDGVLVTAPVAYLLVRILGHP